MRGGLQYETIHLVAHAEWHLVGEVGAGQLVPHPLDDLDGLLVLRLRHAGVAVPCERGAGRWLTSPAAVEEVLGYRVGSRLAVSFTGI